MMPMKYLLLLITCAVLLLHMAVAVVVVVSLVIGPFLIFLILLQVVGLAPRVPLGYNIRNLTVRWRTTALTALAFTLVVGLMTVMLAWVNGMYALTKGSAVPGNVLVLADGVTDEVFSDLGYGDIGTLANKDYIKRAKV